MKKQAIELREEANITQQDMAKKLGISNVALHYYETGQRNIPYKIAKKMAKILNTDIEKIFLPEKFSLR